MITIPELAPRARRRGAALLLAALGTLAQGCVSTEELYAEYDERACRVAVETSADGPVRVREIATDRTMLWEPVIGFALDGDAIAPLERRRLDRDIAVLRAYPELRVSVRGFTDARGATARNRALATRRVENVSAYLSANGIDAARLDEIPVGEGVPLVGRGGGESVPAERRVELLLTDASGRPVPLHVRPVEAGGTALSDGIDGVDETGGTEGEAKGAADRSGAER